MPFASARAWYLAVCTVVGAACGAGDDGGSTRASGAVAAAPPSVASTASGLETSLALHDVQVHLDGNALVSANANQAPRGAILAALAEAAGFELAVGPEAGLEHALSIHLQNEPLEIVLARVLVGISHAFSFEKDAVSGLPRLAQVRVGLEAGAPPLAANQARGRSRSAPRREFTQEEVVERAERAERMWAQSLQNLSSRDSEVRADAAKWLDVNSNEGFEAARDRLENDGSPVVRAAAAEALLDSDSAAVEPLVQALGDPDPRVVLAALEALEFVGDTSTVPRIAPLLKHKDVEVRERTVQAIEFLQ